MNHVLLFPKNLITSFHHLHLNLNFQFDDLKSYFFRLFLFSVFKVVFRSDGWFQVTLLFLLTANLSTLVLECYHHQHLRTQNHLSTLLSQLIAYSRMILSKFHVLFMLENITNSFGFLFLVKMSTYMGIQFFPLAQKCLLF